VIADVIDYLRITSIAKTSEMIFQKIDQLKKGLCELENDHSRYINELRQDKKDEIRIKGQIEFHEEKIKMLKEEYEQCGQQIKKISDEMKAIKEIKGDVYKKFKKQRNDLQKNYDEIMKKTLEEKKIFYEKLNQEQENVLGDLQAIKIIQQRKVNYIVIIDRSGSMGNTMNQVNAAAEKFLIDLKNTQNANFFFTVIYFENVAKVTANTIPFSTVTDFRQFVSLEAGGGTYYSTAFSNAYSIVLDNQRNGIDQVNIIFFTVGGDGDDPQKTYTSLNNMKATFGSQILLYIRGMGLSNFDANNKRQLEKIATVINTGSEVNLNLKDVDLVNDVSEITKFFVTISKGIVDHYTSIKEKLRSLESLRDTLQQEDKRTTETTIVVILRLLDWMHWRKQTSKKPKIEESC